MKFGYVFLTFRGGLELHILPLVPLSSSMLRWNGWTNTLRACPITDRARALHLLAHEPL